MHIRDITILSYTWYCDITSDIILFYAPLFWGRPIGFLPSSLNFFVASRFATIQKEKEEKTDKSCDNKGIRDNMIFNLAIWKLSNSINSDDKAQNNELYSTEKNYNKRI